MAVPTIDPTTSILSYPQWLTWEFFFSASNTPTSWSVSAGGFPTGMQFQPQTAATGVTSGSLLTAAGTSNPFSDGDVVQFAAIAGGSGLATATPYYVLSVSGQNFQLSATAGGAPVAFSSAITAAAIFQPGQLIGAATIPGISNVQMVATNGTGPSDAQLFTIGIEPAAVAPDSASDLVWDFSGNNIVAQTTSVLNLAPAADGVATLYAKEQDDLFLRLRFVKDGTVISPTVTALEIVFKEFEPDAQILTGTAFSQLGSGDGTNYLLYAKIDGNALKAALSNYEADAGTKFQGLTEIKVTYNNPFGIGPGSVIKTSRTFITDLERDLGES